MQSPYVASLRSGIPETEKTVGENGSVREAFLSAGRAVV